MRVLHVIDKLDVGGAEKIFISLISLLYKKIDVSYLCYLGDGELTTYIEKGIKKENFIRNNKYSIVEAKKIAKILNRYDIIHVHMRHNYRYIRFISLLFNVAPKIILHDHFGVKVHKSVPYLFKTLFKPNFFIGVSNELVDWASYKLKLKKKNIFLLENFVHKKEYSKSNSIKKKGLVIVGNIKPVKNQLFAIEIAEELNKELTIVGRIQDKSYYYLLLEKIKKSNLGDKIKFMHNVIDVQSLLCNYELALMTSFSESGPLVLIEYLAQDLPFISYKTGEVTEQIESDLKELILNNFEKDKWIMKAQEILNKPPKGFNKIYLNTFSSEKYVSKCIKIYQQILSC